MDLWSAPERQFLLYEIAFVCMRKHTHLSSQLLLFLAVYIPIAL